METNANSASAAWTEYVQKSGQPSCAFSTRSAIKIGTGTTTQKKFTRILWIATRISDDIFRVQKINGKMVPTGETQEIPADDFFRDFHPEVDLYNRRVLPTMRKLTKSLAKGDRHRKNGEPYSAELEYNIALEMDEKCVRALFGMGIVYLMRDETDKARNVFSELVDIKAAFQPEHKHLFNEFGIQMRKKGMYEEALSYFQRSLEFDPEDENLYFNLARTCYDKGDLENCLTHLGASLDRNASSDAALHFATHLLKRIPVIKKNAAANGEEMPSQVLQAMDRISKLVKSRPGLAPIKTNKSANQSEKIVHYDNESGEVDIVG